MKNCFICFMLCLVFLVIVFLFVVIVLLYVQMVVLKMFIYGVMLDIIVYFDKIIILLQKLFYWFIVCVVFDLGIIVVDYYLVLVKLYQVVYVMGEIFDLFEFFIDLVSYKVCMQNFVFGFNGFVDVWEIVNEINGEWLWLYFSGSVVMVDVEEVVIGQMVVVVYSIVKGVGGKIVIMFYYNDDSKGINCWEKLQDYWKIWFISFFFIIVCQQIDYVFFSYYLYKDCFNFKFFWNVDFVVLEIIFFNVKVGFGEIGIFSKLVFYFVQLNLIIIYYLMVNFSIDFCFVGGFFWWNYVEQMVFYIIIYWMLLCNIIQLLKVLK